MVEEQIKKTGVLDRESYEVIKSQSISTERCERSHSNHPNQAQDVCLFPDETISDCVDFSQITDKLYLNLLQK